MINSLPSSCAKFPVPFYYPEGEPHLDEGAGPSEHHSTLVKVGQRYVILRIDHLRHVLTLYIK